MPKLYLRVLTDAHPVYEDEDVVDGYRIGLQWLITENDGSVRGFGETDHRGLQDVADPNVEWLQDPQNTIVFIPSSFVLRVGCQVPGRSTVQIRRALPFAVEEFVATDIESMHIAHGPIKAGEPIQCNLIAREQMDNWLTCFESVGVHAGYFIADAELLDHSATQASLVFLDDEVLVAHTDQAAVVDRSILGMALSTLEVDRLQAIGGQPTDMELGQMPNPCDVQSVELGEAGFINYLAEQFAKRPAFVNLLQGEYRPARAVSKSSARWRGVAALAAVWVVIGFASMLVQGFWASSEAERLEAESYAFYQGIFPKESQPVSTEQLRRRMAAKLGRKLDSGQTSAFIGLTAHLANALEAKNSVLSLSYTEQRRELSAEVMMQGYEQIEALKESLAKQGIAMETTTAQQVDSGIKSQIRVRYES